MSSARTILAPAVAVLFIGLGASLVGAATPGAERTEASLKQEGSSMVSAPDPGSYAVHLVDGRTAMVWFDTQTSVGRPHWVCEVPAKRDGSDAQRISLNAGAAEWRTALREAIRLLDGLVADGE